MPLRSVVYQCTHEIPWEPILGDRGASTLGPVWKTLTDDPETGATTYMVHIPPGWSSAVLDWHAYVEEVFILSGEIDQGENVHGFGYVYRPPEVIHGPYAVRGTTGFTVLHRQDKPLKIQHVADPPPGARHGDPLSDAWRTAPMQWIDWLDPETVAPAAVASGPWAGATARWLNRDARGGGAILLDLPAGFDGEGTRVGGDVEEFVTHGSLLAGADRLDTWGYTCRADGRAADRYRSEAGARLFCWWAVDELAA